MLTRTSTPQIEAIVAAANAKVAEDAPVHVFKLTKAEAESKYGQLMYDGFKLESDELTVTNWDAWVCWL